MSTGGLNRPLIEEIADAWGWIGLVPSEIIGQNAFGNLIVRAADGRYWRITPEELHCGVIAEDADRFTELSQNADFVVDWEMARLVGIAHEKCGPLADGHVTA